MATPLPSTAALATRPSTHGAVRVSLGAIRDYLAGLLGTDGEIATALATLGVTLSQLASLTAATTLTPADRGKLISATGTWALTLPSAAAAGSGWCILVRNGGAGVISVTPSGSDQIDATALYALPSGWAVLVMSDGTGWVTVKLPAASAVTLSDLNGAVSMDAAGVATGKVIEEGVNRHGRHVKFSNGWMICTREAMTLGRATTASGTGFRSASTTWTFPQAFVTPPVVLGQTDDVDVGLTAAKPGTTSVAVRAASATSKAVILSGQLTAIGRWGGVGLASPGLATPRFWYDPADVATLFTDTAGTTPVTQPGDLVARINDKSGNGYHLLQATSTKRPSFQIEDGRAYLQFDGVDDALTATAVDFSMTSAVSIFAAARKDTLVAGQNIVELLTSIGTTSQTFRLSGEQSADTFRFASAGTTEVFGTGGGVGVVPVVLALLASIPGPSLRGRSQGVEVLNLTGSQGTGNYGVQDLWVGTRAGGGRPLNGRIYGLVGYAAALSAADVKAVEDWLNQRCGAF